MQSEQANKKINSLKINKDLMYIFNFFYFNAELYLSSIKISHKGRLHFKYLSYKFCRFYDFINPLNLKIIFMHSSTYLLLSLIISSIKVPIFSADSQLIFISIESITFPLSPLEAN